MNNDTKTLQMRAKIISNAMYGFNSFGTPNVNHRVYPFGSLTKSLETIDYILPMKYQMMMTIRDAKYLVDYTKSNKHLYCWWTIKHSSGYYAVGPYVHKQVIKVLENIGDDLVEYFSKGMVVSCDHYRPKMKGGHRHNARVNAEKVKCFRSKTARKMAKYALNYDKLTPKQKKRLLSYEPMSNRRIHFHD